MAREVEATSITIPYDWSQPTFHHPVVEKLYQIPSGEEGYIEIVGLQLDELPRDTLIADLRTVLRDMIVRFDTWREVEEGAPFETLEHALKLLAYYEASEALPDVLNLARMDGEFSEHFFGWELEETLRLPVYQIGKDRLEEIYAYLTEAGNDGWVRVAVAYTLTQAALQDPERRQEVIGYFQRLFRYLLDHQDDTGLMDTNFITHVVSQSTDLRAPELFGPIRELYEAGWVAPDVMGDLYEIEYRLHQPPDPKDLLTIPTDLRGYYVREAPKVSSPNPMKNFQEFLLANKSPVERLIWKERDRQADRPIYPGLGGGRVAPARSRKVGRNEPCPCGSGRKYKRCCLGGVDR